MCLAYPFSEQELESEHFVKRMDKLTQQCVEFIAHYKSLGYDVDYLPFYHGADEKIIRIIQEQLKSDDKILQRDVDYDLDTINDLFCHYEFGLCMRFHSILLSIKNQLPVVAIAYDYKSEQLMQEAGLEKYSVKFGIRKTEFFGEEIDIEGDTLCQIAKHLHADREDIMEKSQYFTNMKRKQVLDNYQQIFKLIL